MILSKEGGHPHALTDNSFEALFTADKPMVINFHGYPSVIKSLLFDRPHINRRITVVSYTIQLYLYNIIILFETNFSFFKKRIRNL